MSQFLHQIFYANNKFEITNDTYMELRKWAIPTHEAIYTEPNISIHMENNSQNANVNNVKETMDLYIPLPENKNEILHAQEDNAIIPTHTIVSHSSVPKQRHISSNLTIFQSIFILHYGYSEYMMLGNRINNREISEKQKIIEELTKTPKKMKDGNHRLTHDNIQEIISGLLVSSKEEIMQLVAYSVYYNKIIYLVFRHSYLIFAPTKDTTVTETAILNHDVYILNQTRKHPKYGGSYYPDMEPTLEKLSKIHETKVHLEHYAKPFRGISTYKMADLEEIASKIGILEKGNNGKKYKKCELYNKMVEICCEGICA